MKKTKVQLYVDWDHHTILNNAEYHEAIKQRATQEKADMEEFDDWVSCNYQAHELFHMKEAEKAAVQKEFEDYCFELAGDILDDYYEEVTVSVDSADFV